MNTYIYGFLILVCSLGVNAQSNNSSFTPESGQYIITGWVQERHEIAPRTYEDSAIEVVQGGASYTFFPSGEIIDGWQRIYGTFTIVESLDLNIKLKATKQGVTCFFDDIRVVPFNGNMKSFVYDSQTQRLMAELDENNYATFYEYDNEGGLIRVKKETNRGIKTIQETRSSTTKQ